MDGEFPRHGEIWLAALDPVFGREIGKTRPAVVLSNDRNNQYADTVTIVPITSKTDKIYPYETLLPNEETGLRQNSKAKTDHIRTVDKRRFVKKIGEVPLIRLSSIKEAVKIHLSIE
jgi:mRNA interferase MazF